MRKEIGQMYDRNTPEEIAKHKAKMAITMKEAEKKRNISESQLRCVLHA